VQIDWAIVFGVFLNDFSLLENQIWNLGVVFFAIFYDLALSWSFWPL
jgi:hypothetical protein